MSFKNIKFLARGIEALENRNLFAVSAAPGVGWDAQGADLAYVDLNRNGIDDVIAMAYDSPAGANQFRYRIGYDVNHQGIASRWSGINYGPSLGWEGQGAGVAVTDLDGDSTPEVIFMAYDNPSGANNFRYMVGYDMNSSGRVASWSSMQITDGVGWEADGAGIAIGNVDYNSRPDAVLMAYDDPARMNSFRYKIGYNLDSAGRAQYYSSPIVIPGVGWEAAGASIELGNLDSDPRPDILVMAYDDPSGGNTYRLKVGYNIDSRGHAQSWSSPMEIAGQGWEGDGAGMALTDYDRDGQDEVVFMAYDDPAGANEFRFRSHELQTSSQVIGSQLVVNVGVRGETTAISQSFGTLIVTKTNLDGTRSYNYHAARGVTSIRVNGSDGRDLIQNNTALPATIFGRDGNDQLQGGTSVDYLYGGNGNDGLFGGKGSRDVLHGGSGADRFLQPQEDYRPWYLFGFTAQRDEDVISDFSRNYDAELEFFDEEKDWTDREIRLVDDAFSMLHDVTGNTRLLRDSVRSDSLRFYRYRNESDQAGCGNIACNYRSNHHIYVGDGTFSRDSWAVQTIIHEIGHNWDDTSENSFVSAFRATSDWIILPAHIGSNIHVQATNGWWRLRNAEFAREYGGDTNPQEDFATAFAAYVMTVNDEPGYTYQMDTGTTNGFRNWINGNGTMPAKIRIMDQWVHSLV